MAFVAAENGFRRDFDAVFFWVKGENAKPSVAAADLIGAMVCACRQFGFGAGEIELVVGEYFFDDVAVVALRRFEFAAADVTAQRHNHVGVARREIGPKFAAFGAVCNVGDV